MKNGRIFGENIKAVAGVLVIFMLGIMTGVLASGLVMEHRIESFHKKGPPPLKPLLMRRIAGSLELSRNQKKVVEKSINRLQERLKEIRRSFHPQIRAAFEDCYGEIENHLDSHQKGRMERLIRQMPGPFCPAKRHGRKRFPLRSKGKD